MTKENIMGGFKMSTFQVILEDDFDHEVLDLQILKNGTDEYWVKGYDYSDYESAVEDGKWLAKFLEVEFVET